MEMTRETDQPSTERRNSGFANKLQSQLSNLTYRKSKPSIATASSSEPQYDLNFDVALEGLPCPIHVQFRASKNMKAEDILRHVLHQLASSGYQRHGHGIESYYLSEVVYDEDGQICKERRLNLDDHPAQLQLLWPKEQVSPDGESEGPRETYGFRVGDTALDGVDQTLQSNWVECDLASYFASDSYLHKFFSEDHTVADLCQLPELTENSILDNLKERFDEGRIYTAAGPSILVSINPFRWLPLYNPKVVSLYQSDLQPSLKLPPHIFAIADTAYSTLMRHRRDQCILITGESGSGKTECTHFILHHLTALSHKGQQGGRIEQSILSAAPVLEAFGNAKTAHNYNSSRFGKYIQVYYKPDGKVSRANVQQYLLEKSRIVSQARNERNYHVFYYLLAGSTPEEKRKWQLFDASTYEYLNQSDYEGYERDMNGVDCAFEFDRLKQAMEMVGFTREMQTRIFSVLSAVLHIGNIQYVKKASSYHHDESVIIQNREVLQRVAQLLQVDEELLHSALISKCAIAYNEQLVMNYKLPEAINARDALAKLLYVSLFDWIVNQTNRLLNNKITSNKDVCIGVLDIFGFENFEKNGFEQFCINYANEHLQSYFNLHVFKHEQDEYLSEGIEWSPIQYTDNSGCLDLIQQKPYGLLPLLNEECSFPGATNETLLEKYRRHQVTNEFFDSPQKRENAFIIHHYAGTVKYDVKNFREKNSDVNRAADLVTLLKTSGLSLIREMIAESPNAIARWKMLKLTVFTVLAFTRKTRRRQSFSAESVSSHSSLDQRASVGSIGSKGAPVATKRNFSPQSSGRQHRTMDLNFHPKPRRVGHQTVTSQFQQSLTKLMEALNRADPYFIRCIKSNNTKTPGLFDTETVLRQLRYSGMLETVRIRQSGFHIRLTFKEFVNQYHAMVPDDFGFSPSEIRTCLIHWGLDPNGFQIGRRKIYLRESDKNLLDEILHRVVLRKIIKIQRWWRNSHKELRERSAVAIQRHWRGYVVRNEYRRQRVATVLIQRWWRATQRKKKAKTRKIVPHHRSLPLEEDMESSDEDDDDYEPVVPSPVNQLVTNGHVTPFSSFSSDWNSNHSDEGVQLAKIASMERLERLSNITEKTAEAAPSPVIERRKSTESVLVDRPRRDSEEESSGILDDSEPESYSRSMRRERNKTNKNLTTTLGNASPPVEPKPWRRYSAIERHIPFSPPTLPETPEPIQERSADGYMEKPIDVEQLEASPTRPSPPRQINGQRVTRRDTLPNRETFAEPEPKEEPKSRIGAFRNWLEKRVSSKKKSLGDSSASSRKSPEVEEEKPALQRSGAGRVPLKPGQKGSVARRSPPLKKQQTTAKRSRSAHLKAASGESLFQPLTRTFSKNRLTRRQPTEDGDARSKEKDSSWNCRSITEFTDSEERVVSSAEELQELEAFIFDKIVQLEAEGRSKSSAKADTIFRSGLKEFRVNLISTYSVAAKDVKLCIRYRDLIVNFEKTIRVACYKNFSSGSSYKAPLAQFDGEPEAFPVNMAINGFRSFMNEFIQKQQIKQKKEDRQTLRNLSRRRKQSEPTVIVRNGHHLAAVNMFNLPTACEVCSSFLWPMEKSLVCQSCKTTCHKKCYTKIEGNCTGKKKIKAKPGSPLSELHPTEPSGKVFCVPLDCLLHSGEKIPAICDRFITVIELEGLYTEGIYRKSGSAVGMRQMRAEIEANPDKVDLDKFRDSGIHVLASTFKALLREMPQPLMTYERYDELMQVMEFEDPEEQLQSVYCAIRKMPKPNHDLLERLFFHLARIAQHADVNLMTAENLATIFAPVLFKSERELKSFEVSTNCKKQIRCIQIVIDAQLQKLQLTLEDIIQIDSAAASANTRLSVIRSSKVFMESHHSSVSSGAMPESIPDADEEEVRLSEEILSLRKEKEKRALDLASLRLSRQVSAGGENSDEDDSRSPAEVWNARKSSLNTNRPSSSGRHALQTKSERALVWL